MADTHAPTETTTALHQQWHAAFNAQDWDALLQVIAPECTYIDHARRETAVGPGQVVDLIQRWAEVFPDCRIIEGALYDSAGDVSTARFVGIGTQDGPIGPFPPSGREARTNFCEVIRVDSAGMVAAGEIYYDQLGLLSALGHIPAMEG